MLSRKNKECTPPLPQIQVAEHDAQYSGYHKEYLYHVEDRSGEPRTIASEQRADPQEHEDDSPFPTDRRRELDYNPDEDHDRAAEMIRTDARSQPECSEAARSVMPDRIPERCSELCELAHHTALPLGNAPPGMAFYPARHLHLTAEHALLRRDLITHVIQADVLASRRI